MLAAREAKGLTQVQACRAIGCSQGTLAELEATTLSSGLTPQFAELYGVDAAWLARGPGTEPMKTPAKHVAAEPAARYGSARPGGGPTTRELAQQINALNAAVHVILSNLTPQQQERAAAQLDQVLQFGRASLESSLASDEEVARAAELHSSLLTALRPSTPSR